MSRVDSRRQLANGSCAFISAQPVARTISGDAVRAISLDCSNVCSTASSACCSLPASQKWIGEQCHQESFRASRSFAAKDSSFMSRVFHQTKAPENANEMAISMKKSGRRSPANQSSVRNKTPPPSASPSPPPSPAEPIEVTNGIAMGNGAAVDIRSASASQITAAPSDIWEIDFYSRPVVDASGKKVWELLVTDSAGKLRYSQFFEPGTVNATGLRDALKALMCRVKIRPRIIRYFRQTMANTIRIATAELPVILRPSRRTFALLQWMKDRLDPDTGFYAQLPGFQPASGGAPSAFYVKTPPVALPDALRGEKWAFISIPKRDLVEVCNEERFLNQASPLTADQLALDDDIAIPGVVIFTERAKPLCGWMAGAEIAYLEVERDTGSGAATALIVEAGAAERWMFSTLGSPLLKQDAERFDKEKNQALSLHFVGVKTPESDDLTGFFLLQEMPFV